MRKWKFINCVSNYACIFNNRFIEFKSNTNYCIYCTYFTEVSFIISFKVWFEEQEYLLTTYFLMWENHYSYMYTTYFSLSYEVQGYYPVYEWKFLSSTAFGMFIDFREPADYKIITVCRHRTLLLKIMLALLFNNNNTIPTQLQHFIFTMSNTHYPQGDVNS